MNALLRLHARSSAFDRPLTEWGGTLLALAIRLHVGWVFFKSGLTKLDDWDSTLFLFKEEYQVPLLPPELAAWAGTLGELVFPLLLFAGLFTRPAALALFGVNLMAVLSYPALFEFECPAPINDHFHWGVLLMVLLAFGPGRLSIDSALASRHR